MRIPALTEVVTLSGDRTVDRSDHDTFFVCDIDAALGDITITVNEALPGVRMAFRKKVGQEVGNVVFAQGTGVTLAGHGSLTTANGVAKLIYDESGLNATVYGDS